MSYDMETAIEDVLIELINDFTDVKTVRWEDVSEAHLAPRSSYKTGDVIKVRASSISEETGTLNLFAGETILVDVVAFASKKRDTAARAVNKLRGKIREVFAQSDIVTQINNFGTIQVYAQGVIPTGTFEATDEKNYGKGITVQIVAIPML